MSRAAQVAEIAGHQVVPNTAFMDDRRSGHPRARAASVLSGFAEYSEGRPMHESLHHQNSNVIDGRWTVTRLPLLSFCSSPFSLDEVDGLTFHGP